MRPKVSRREGMYRKISGRIFFTSHLVGAELYLVFMVGPALKAGTVTKGVRSSFIYRTTQLSFIGHMMKIHNQTKTIKLTADLSTKSPQNRA